MALVDYTKMSFDERKKKAQQEIDASPFKADAMNYSKLDPTKQQAVRNKIESIRNGYGLQSDANGTNIRDLYATQEIGYKPKPINPAAQAYLDQYAPQQQPKQNLLGLRQMFEGVKDQSGNNKYKVGWNGKDVLVNGNVFDTGYANSGISNVNGSMMGSQDALNNALARYRSMYEKDGVPVAQPKQFNQNDINNAMNNVFNNSVQPQQNGQYDFTKSPNTQGMVQSNTLESKPALDNIVSDGTKKTTDQIIQEKLKAYLDGFKPTTTQEDYMNKQKDMINTSANLAYDSLKDDLRNRVAKVLTGYGLQLGTLDTRYNPQYQANQKAQFMAQDNVKKILASRGMLGSGVDVGNQQQILSDYASKRQGIDDTKTQERQKLESDMNQANTDMNNEITSIDKKKADFIAQQEALARQRYDEQIAKERDSYKQDFFNAQNTSIARDQADTARELGFKNLEIDRDKLNEDIRQFGEEIKYKYKALDQSASQYAANLGLEYDKMDSENKRWYDQLAQQDRQFGMGFVRAAYEFSKEMGYKYDDMAQKGAQFERQMKFNELDLKERMRIEEAKLAQQKELTYAEIGAANARAAASKRDYDAELKLKYANADLNYQEFVGKENSRIDQWLFEALEKSKAGVKGYEPDKIPGMFSSLVKTSPLDQDYKNSKLSQINSWLPDPGKQAREASDFMKKGIKINLVDSQPKITSVYQSGIR